VTIFEEITSTIKLRYLSFEITFSEIRIKKKRNGLSPDPPTANEFIL